MLKTVYNKEIPVSYEEIFASCVKVEACMINKIKTIFSGANSRPALCSDEWTSISKKRFLNIQAYFEEKKISLGVIRISERCTGVELACLIKKQLSKFGVTSLFMCTDGASNMAKCTFELGFQQIKCMLHGINLGN